MTAVLLDVEQINKSFPGTHALRDVSFDLLPGEVHALMGENGAGKSTLMHILCGVYAPDSGTIRLGSQVVQMNGPRHAQELGIGMVFQELSLAPGLSIAENVFPNRAPIRAGAFVDWNALYRRTRDLLAQFDLEIDPRTLARDLNITTRQIVEIVKALSLNARILLLDEPTSALPPDEVSRLFSVIRRLKEKGIGIVYISHRIPEVMEIADRVTVLRDGQRVGTHPIGELTPDRIIEMMVGRKLADLYPDRAEGLGSELLRVEHLSGVKSFSDVSFTLRRGEIIGLAGLLGARRGELLRALVGDVPISGGRLFVEGKPVRITSPGQAFALGMAYLPEERKSDGLFLKMPLRQNISVTALRRFARMGLMDSRSETSVAQEFVNRLRIRTPGVQQLVGRLSGGNQQKVMLSKWLVRTPQILIIDEPTKGVDVGAKVEIHALLRDLARQGAGIVFVSTEFPEIIGLADRILVMHEGRIVGEVAAAQATEQSLLRMSSGYQAENQPAGVQS
ncbi:MAG: sugar ABC transporter ATP-binding protein [Anaerolineae bacterium]|nr:sugar ABC transporter ATP-binding protein [Anaerolineae bacterium]